jgi:hypothetical protein
MSLPALAVSQASSGAHPPRCGAGALSAAETAMRTWTPLGAIRLQVMLALRLLS